MGRSELMNFRAWILRDTVSGAKVVLYAYKLNNYALMFKGSSFCTSHRASAHILQFVVIYCFLRRVSQTYT